MGVAFGQPGVVGDVEAIDKKRAAFLHCIQCNRGITGAAAEATKRCGVIGVGLSSNEIAVGGQAPKIGAGGMEVGASSGAERLDELVGIAVLKRIARKIEEKLLESLVRVRRVAGTRVSGWVSQCALIA